MSFFSFDKLDPAQLENARQKIYLLVIKHMETLIEKRKKGIKTDDYGNIDASKWNKETQNFVDRVFVPLLTQNEAKAVKSYGVSKFANIYIEDPVRTQSFYKRIQSERQQPSGPLTPIQYEEYCAKLISNQGWSCEATKVTGDQGADIKAKKNGKTLVVQCKQYSSSVGNAAVQEVISARGFYSAHYAAVVTNSTYTKSAMELAKRTGVILLNHDEIVQLDRRISLII